MNHIERRKGNSFPYTKEIQKPFGKLDDVIVWCKTEMQYEWRWELLEVSTDHRPGRYRFYFDNERDYCAFLLRWT